MKRSVIIIISVLIICVAAICFFVLRGNGRFQSAQQVAESISVGWNLGNTLDSNGDWIGLYSEGKPENYETAWGNPVTTPELFAAVKNAGFNAVRIPVTWREHIDENGNIDPEWIGRVQEVVDYAIELDMYCVLNVHHDSGGGGWLRATPECYEENSAKFAALWRSIAEHFKEYGDKLIFEGFNEMLDSGNRWGGAGSAEEYKTHSDFNQLFVDTVRATGGNNAQRNLMVQIYSGVCGEDAMDKFVLPKDSTEGHLMIQVHCYDPQPFTWTSVDYAEPMLDWGSDADKLQLEDIFSRLAALSERHGVPVVIGECGADYKENEAARKAYVTHFLTCAEARGIKCFWWDTGAMSLFDRNACTELYPEITDIIDELT